MKKLFAIMAIAGIMVACNNNSESKDVKKDSAAMMDSMNKVIDNTKDSVNKMMDNTKDSANKMMNNTKDSLKKIEGKKSKM